MRQYRQGFTLIELMIAVTIISVMAAALLPGISTAMAESRAANAAVDVVRIGRRARSETIGNGLAHLLAYTADETTGLGVLSLYRGTSNLCNLQNWNLATLALIDEVDMAEYNLVVHRIQLAPTTAGMQEINICYQPDGAMLIRNGAGGVFQQAIGGASDVQFQVTRSVGGTEQGAPRYVIFPFGGNARIQR